MMASPTANKTSWLKEKLSRKLSGQAKNSGQNSWSYEENGLDDFERIEPDFVEGTSSLVSRSAPELDEDWEVLTLAKQQKNNGSHPNMDSNHIDGVSIQGGNKGGGRKISNNKLMSPILGGRGGIKSVLKQTDKKLLGDMDRPASAGANVHRSTTNGKKKLLPPDGHTHVHSSRTPSPGMERNASQRSSFRRKGGNNVTKESSPVDGDHPAGSGSNFSKLRDTLRIRKGKKKATKVAQYSVPELNFPVKYQDPFDVSADFSENLDGMEGLGHEFVSIDIPHHKPEYCDHCQQAAWGHGQTLKCTKCDFIVHKKCEARVFVKCSLKAETDAVLQRDRANETMEETSDPLLEKELKSLGTEPMQNGQQANSSSSSGSNGIHVHTNSEKALLARKIREYNRKTTPVHHIHIKSRDTTIDYQGFVRVHMSIQRPIHVSTGVTRTSWYRLMRPVKEKPGPYGLDGAGALETAFYLPIDTNRLVHINNTTTTKELIITLLKKFCITDNPKKFSLYEEYGGDCRRLFEEDRPLTVILDGSVAGRNSKLVLRDNLCSTIQWDAFSYPELNNFIIILHREEEIYASRLTDCFTQWKKYIEEEMKSKDPSYTPQPSTSTSDKKQKHLVNGETHHHPLTVSKHAPLVK